MCPFCNSKLKNQFKRHLQSCCYVKVKKPSLEEIRIAHASMRGFCVDGSDFLLCPIQNCQVVLSNKNVGRHFKKQHPLSYASASDCLKFKKEYVPVKKYFAIMKQLTDEEASYAIDKHVSGHNITGTEEMLESHTVYTDKESLSGHNDTGTEERLESHTVYTKGTI